MPPRDVRSEVVLVTDAPIEDPDPIAIDRTVRVRVVDATSRAGVPGAHVTLSRQGDLGWSDLAAETLHLVADSDGRADLAVPLDWGPSLRLDATSADGARCTAAARSARPGDEVELRITPAPFVEGIVTNLGATPPATVRVLAYGPDWAEAPKKRALTIDATGRFRVAGATRLLSLFATAPGRVPSATWRASEHAETGSGGEIVLDLGPPSQRVDVTVLVEDGTPLPRGALVRYATNGTWLAAAVGDDGRVRLDGVAPGTGVDVHVAPLSVTGEGVPRTAPFEGRLAADELASGAEIRVPRALDVAFVANTPEGVSVGGLRVRLRHMDDADPSRQLTSRELEFDALGVARPPVQAGLPAGAYRLESEDGLRLWHGRLDVATGPQEVPVSLRTFVVDQVRLIGRSGRPIASPSTNVVRVDADVGRTSTGPEIRLLRTAGTLLLRSRFVGSALRLEVRFVGFAAVPVTLQPGGGVVDVALPPGAARVTANFVDGLHPMSGYLQLESVDDPRQRYWMPIAPGGASVSIEPVAPGLYRWSTTGTGLPGGERQGPTELRVDAGADVAFDIR